MIRDAVIGDIGELIDLCQEAWDTSYHSKLEMDRNKTLELIRGYVKADHKFAKVIVIEGEIVGGLAGYSFKPPMTQAIAVSDEFFYMRQNVSRGTIYTKKLLQQFIEWAKGRDASLISMYASHGSKRGERAGRLLESAGLTKSGSVYYWVKDN